MSHEACTYVKRFSPFTGNTFWFHFIMADMANAGHGYRVWIHAEQLKKDWPVLSDDAITRGRKALVDAGELELLEHNAPGRAASYRFTFKQCPELMADTPQNAGCNTPQNPDRSPRKMRTVTQPDLLTGTKGVTEPPSGGRKAKYATPLPDQFFVSDAMRDWLHLNQLEHLDWRTETAQFCDHHRARGSVMKDWTAAWRTWMRNAGKWQAEHPLSGVAKQGYATLVSKKDQLLQQQMAVAAQAREAARANGRH